MASAFCKYLAVGDDRFDPLGLDFFELLAELLLEDSEDSGAKPESRLPTSSGRVAAGAVIL